MWVKKRRNIAFIHIPRTGGTALKLKIGGMRKRTPWAHAKLNDVPNPELYVDYKLISIVRNPYHRLASAYHRRYRIMHRPSRRGCESQPELSDLYVTMKRFGSFLSHFAETNELQQRVYLEHEFLACETFKFEDTDITELARQLNKVARPIKLNKGRPVSYFGKYWWPDWVDAEGVEIINDVCKEDFREFGYNRKTWRQIENMQKADDK